jgi:hypothetical protein
MALHLTSAKLAVLGEQINQLCRHGVVSAGLFNSSSPAFWLYRVHVSWTKLCLCPPQWYTLGHWSWRICDGWPSKPWFTCAFMRGLETHCVCTLLHVYHLNSGREFVSFSTDVAGVMFSICRPWCGIQISLPSWPLRQSWAVGVCYPLS